LGLAIEGGTLVHVINAAVSNNITVGMAVFLLGALKRFDGATHGFSSVASNLIGHLGFLRKCFKLIDGGQELKRVKDNSHYLPLSTERGVEITFENVTFAYPNSDRQIFENFNLTLKAGMFVGIVGDIGAGKSTLTNLITGAYTPSNGRILANGIPINEIRPSEWRSNIAFMNPDSPLLETYTIEEFIAMGRREPREDSADIAAVTRELGSDEIIKRAKHGPQTVLGEGFDKGTRVSSGEKQMILASRALVREPNILILDEPGANLDIEREQRLSEALSTQSDGTRTRIVISHRYGSIKNADLILVVEKGKIIERGNHAELMKIGGTYARKYNLQQQK
jgi:ATP-binding cassette subfamily B protein